MVPMRNTVIGEYSWLGPTPSIRVIKPVTEESQRKKEMVSEAEIR